ncbi:hypothetical protein EJB05_50730 [Eragrostis curvula]|uniref:Phytocyanin domain-containing protein n=1 Tax=Eragrostis curvula TaxID=38414 RepID=A0A5J9SXL6_9POAL|nr:hypothetical protein EJB05_50730 [Eragrostis curvula]
MASLPVALFAASCVLLLAASAAAPPPAVHVVGGERGWTVPPSGNAAGEASFDQWAASRRFHVGDLLGFKYSNNDSVLLVSRGGYEQCATTSAVSRFDGGDTRFALDRPGHVYFVSGAPGHCEAGQRMAVRVTAALSSPATATAPASVPATPGTPSAAAGSTGPATIVLKLTPSLLLWIATVFVFVFLLIFVLLFCWYQQGKLVETFIDVPVARNPGV